MSVGYKTFKREIMWSSKNFKEAMDKQSTELKNKGIPFHATDLTEKIAKDVIPFLEFDMSTLTYKYKQKKKGSVLDFLYLIITLFIIALTLFCTFIFIDKVNSTGLFADYDKAQASVDDGINAIKGWDNLFLYVIIGFSIFCFISSMYSFEHPVLFILMYIILGILLIVAATFSNAYSDVISVGEISIAASNFPKITWFMLNLPKYIFFMGVLTFIGVFISSKNQ